ncbi:MAG: RHS repeat-associated core domain-containing protein [Candidatus Obscuribacterales bacterium]
MIDTFAYSPWGESGSMSGTTFGFTGQRYDAETGLYFYKNRHYSPVIGRFLQPDPIGYGDGLNMYQYGYNNPNSFTDPLGLAADGSIMNADTAAPHIGAGIIEVPVPFSNLQMTLPPGWDWSKVNRELHNAKIRGQMDRDFAGLFSYFSEIRTELALRVRAYTTIISLFAPGQVYDFKARYPVSEYPDLKSDPYATGVTNKLEFFGNWFFGAWLAAYGVTTFESLLGAGVTQVFVDIWQWLKVQVSPLSIVLPGDPLLEKAARLAACIFSSNLAGNSHRKWPVSIVESGRQFSFNLAGHSHRKWPLANRIF